MHDCPYRRPQTLNPKPYISLALFSDASKEVSWMLASRQLSTREAVGHSIHTNVSAAQRWSVLTRLFIYLQGRITWRMCAWYRVCAALEPQKASLLRRRAQRMYCQFRSNAG